MSQGLLFLYDAGVSSLAHSPDGLDRLARRLFRFRSLTPVPVLVAALVLSWRDQAEPGPGGPAVDALLDVVGLGVTALGWLVRFAAAGFAPTVRSQTKQIAPRALRTEGLYQVVRHPLYLGNSLMTLGLLLVVNQPAAYLLVGPAFALQYALIIRTEDRLLRHAFVAQWEAWAERTKGLWPRLAAPGALAKSPFAWRAAIRRETNPLVAAGIGAMALLGWEWWARGALTPDRRYGIQVGTGALLGLLLANKVWKKVDRR